MTFTGGEIMSHWQNSLWEFKAFEFFGVCFLGAQG